MTQDDVIDVLTKCAAYDQRTVGKYDVLAWFEVLDDLARADALTAVADWYREHHERIMPSNVRAGVEAIQARRLATLPADDILMADVDPNAPDWTAIKAARVHAWAGREQPPAIDGGSK